MLKNPYLFTENCAIRLYEEWKLHKRLIVACDHDNTVFDYHDQGHEYSDVVEVLKECQKYNFYIVVFTGTDKKNWPKLTTHWENLNIKIDKINENPIELPFGNHGKIYYNILLDDRAGLGQALEILKQLLIKIKNND